MPDTVAIRRSGRRWAIFTICILTAMAAIQWRAYEELKRGTAMGDSLILWGQESREARKAADASTAHISIVADSVLKFVSHRSELNASRQRRMEDRIVRRILSVQSVVDTMKSNLPAPKRKKP